MCPGGNDGMGFWERDVERDRSCSSCALFGYCIFGLDGW